jgi:hypothetical protein
MAKKKDNPKVVNIFETNDIDTLQTELNDVRASLLIHEHNGRNSRLVDILANRRDIKDVATRQVVTLTDTATITTNASLGDIFTVTFGGNRTLSNPTNSIDGQRCVWIITQGSGGSKILTLGAAFNDGPWTMTLSTGAGDIDYIEALYDRTSGEWRILNFQKGY